MQVILSDYIEFIQSLPTRISNILLRPCHFTASEGLNTLQKAAFTSTATTLFRQTVAEFAFRNYANVCEISLNWLILNSKENAALVKNVISSLSHKAQNNCFKKFLSIIPKSGFNDVIKPLLPLFPEFDAIIFRISTSTVLSGDAAYHLGRIVGNGNKLIFMKYINYWSNSRVITSVSIDQRKQVAVIIVRDFLIVFEILQVE